MGGNHNDTIYGDEGNDSINGGLGTDAVQWDVEDILSLIETILP